MVRSVYVIDFEAAFRLALPDPGPDQSHGPPANLREQILVDLHRTASVRHGVWSVFRSATGARSTSRGATTEHRGCRFTGSGDARARARKAKVGAQAEQIRHAGARGGGARAGAGDDDVAGRG